MAVTNTGRIALKIRAPAVQDNPRASSAGAIDALVRLSSTDITKRHHRIYNVGASGSTSLDLVSALNDSFGGSQTFSTVKVIYIRNRSTSATRGGTVGWSSNGVPFISAAATSPVNPVYLWVNTSGTTVTAGTGDIILIANSDAAAAADIEVLILGT